MPAKLYVVPASHPCAAVMRALELKGVDYERVDLLPVYHKVAQRARFGRPGTVPGLVLQDGTKVHGSRAIMHELERRVPQPPLFPSGGDERRRVEEADEWGDQTLQPLVRRLLWHALAERPGAQLSYLEGARVFPPAPRPLARLSASGVAWAERRFNASTEPAVRADLAHLPSHLDRIDRWIANGVLGGEAPNAADLQIGASVRLLLTLEDLQPLIDGRPAGEHARRQFPRYPGHVPRGALDAAWLPAAAA